MDNEITAPANMEEYFAAKKLRDAAKKANQERQAANSRRKIENTVHKKCQTIMIGSLARFEERFGSLWGYGKPQDELTDEEQVWKETWDVVRTEILNNGNNQIRSIKEELGRYSFNYEGYKIKLPVKSVTITPDNKE